jgi:hypothetical protein
MKYIQSLISNSDSVDPLSIEHAVLCLQVFLYFCLYVLFYLFYLFVCCFCLFIYLLLFISFLFLFLLMNKTHITSKQRFLNLTRMEQENLKNKGDVVTLSFSKLGDIGAKEIELSFHENDTFDFVKYKLSKFLGCPYSAVQIISEVCLFDYFVAFFFILPAFFFFFFFVFIYFICVFFYFFFLFCRENLFLETDVP